MNTKSKIKKTLAVFVIGIIALQSCKKDGDDGRENELITTVQLVMTDSANSANQYVFTFADLDGDQPNAPVQFDSIVLPANGTFYCTVQLLDESKNPVDTITKEVIAEADDHLFVYKPNPASLVNIQIADKDSKNLPLGVLSTWRTGSAGTGTTQVVLRHQPGSKNGTETPGDSDVDVTFKTVVHL